jgi:formylmethanofuran dehydrogenase subunit E
MTKYGIPGYSKRRRRTRGKGRKINYDKEKPRNLGKLLEEAIDHLSTHDCEECGEIISSFKVNLLSPFGIRCYGCEEIVTDSTFVVSNEGRIFCQKCGPSNEIKNLFDVE